MAIKANTKPSNKPPATPVPAPAPPPDTSAQEAEKKNIETKQGELRGKISENDVKISRLNDTERKLRPYVLEVETLYNNFLGEYDKDAVWVGERYTKYHDYAEFTFFASYRDYNNKSYDFLDDIKQKVIFKGYTDEDEELMVENINVWIKQSDFKKGDPYALNKQNGIVEELKAEVEG